MDRFDTAPKTASRLTLATTSPRPFSFMLLPLLLLLLLPLLLLLLLLPPSGPCFSQPYTWQYASH